MYGVLLNNDILNTVLVKVHLAISATSKAKSGAKKDIIVKYFSINLEKRDAQETYCSIMVCNAVSSKYWWETEKNPPKQPTILGRKQSFKSSSTEGKGVNACRNIKHR